MNPLQEKAARALRRALEKIRDANLRLLVYDGSVFVCPTAIDVQGNGKSDPWEVLAEHGSDVSPVGLFADGGAGI